MPWAQVHWRSDVLGKQTAMQVLLPRAGRPPYPALYLLHGLGNDSTAWLRHSRIEWHARELPLIVVMPDGYRGFYTDNEEGPAYARHMGEEVPGFVEKHFQARRGRRARAIGGHSMGGYGALRLAFGYPEKFCSVHSHSGALIHARIDFSQSRAARNKVLKNYPPEFAIELRQIFGRRPQHTAHDLLALVRRARRRGRRLPEILLDCGREDTLFEHTRRFHKDLEAMKVPHTYREFPGAHDWDYWEARLPEALAFHAANLRIAPVKQG